VCCTARKALSLQDNAELQLNYLEIPVNLVYKPVLGAGRLLLGFGPYVGFGLGGKLKVATEQKTDVEFTKNYDIN
jgi:hypothetical protein